MKPVDPLFRNNVTGNLSATLSVNFHHRNNVTDKLLTTLQAEVAFFYTNVNEYFSLALRFRQDTPLDSHNILW